MVNNEIETFRESTEKVVTYTFSLGFICPWVDCEPCLPCQEKEKTMFKSGDLKGCIMEEKCGPTSVIKVSILRTAEKKGVIIDEVSPVISSS